MVAPGLYAASPVTITAVVADLDVELDVEATPMSEGRAGGFVCTEVRATRRGGGPPVTSEALRAIPVARLTRAYAERNIDSYDAEGQPAAAPQMIPAHLAELRAAGPVDETLETVAHLYRRAAVLGDAPRVAVEEAFSLPRSTAGRWITLARQRGHLAPSEGTGKTGG